MIDLSINQSYLKNKFSNKFSSSISSIITIGTTQCEWTPNIFLRLLTVNKQFYHLWVQHSFITIINQDLLVSHKFYYPLLYELKRNKKNQVIMIDIDNIEILSPLSLQVIYSDLIKFLKIDQKITFVTHGLTCIIPALLQSHQIYQKFVGNVYLINPIWGDFIPLPKKKLFEKNGTFEQRFFEEYKKRYFNEIALEFQVFLQKYITTKLIITHQKFIKQLKRLDNKILSNIFNYPKTQFIAIQNNLNSKNPSLLDQFELTPSLILNSGFIFTLNQSREIGKVIDFTISSQKSYKEKMNQQVQKSLQMQEQCYMIKWEGYSIENSIVSLSDNISQQEVSFPKCQSFISKFQKSTLAINGKIVNNNLGDTTISTASEYEIQVAQ